MTDLLTDDLPGTGGTIRQSPEDFAVEEIPLYLPCGEGEHLYILVEKRGLTTHDLVRRIARNVRIQEREIGYAGLKDARAITRQWLSLPGVDENQLERIDIPGVTILEAARHRNKLRLGHLAGNRFRIRIRETEAEAETRAIAILERLQSRGVPNLFGDQRYGLLGNNADIGRALLRGQHEEAVSALLGDPQKIENTRWREGVEHYRAGDLEKACTILPAGCRNERNVLQSLIKGKSPEQAMLRLPRPALRLFLSAWQSQLFDRLVQDRLQNLDRLEDGDLACKHANGACFVVEDAAAEQDRAQSFEISPSAPMFGSKTQLASGAPGTREHKLLEAEALPENAFKLPKGLSLKGERRPMRVPLEDPSARLDASELEVSFSLPRGSFATTVLREIMKADHAS